MSEIKSLTLNDKTYDCFVDSVARNMATWSALTESASGENIVLSDASNYHPIGLHVYGKTTQNGTPTPDAPVELVSVGDDGSITVNVTGENDAQSLTLLTPNGLPGIPVSSGGNYTDANGQQWVCDEIDLAKGVRIQRIGTWVIDGTKVPTTFVAGNKGGTILGYLYTDVMSGISTDRSPKMCDKLQAPSTAYPSSYKDCKVGYWGFNTSGADTPDAFLVFNLGEFSTADEAAAYLRENPLTFICKLGTPIKTSLSEDELAAYADLHTYQDHTTVSNDAGAWMTLEYVMDAKKYIDSLVGTGGSIIPATVE